MITTKEVIKILKEIALLLDLNKENSFKVNTFLKAARIIENLDLSIEELLEQIESSQIKGVGKSIGGIVVELVKTGKVSLIQELRENIPTGLEELHKIPGLSTKKIQVLYDQLQITNILDLEKACEKNQLSQVKGFGLKSQQNILEGILKIKTYIGKFYYYEAVKIANELVSALHKSGLCNQLEIVGELRRHNEIIKKIDLLASSPSSKKLIEFFCSYPEVEIVTKREEVESSVILKSGIEVKISIVSESEFPNALLYLTGSEKHLLKLEIQANKLNLTIDKNSLSEKDIYNKLNLAFIPPELREDLGEIEYAQDLFKHRIDFPALATEQDIKGILHVHTTYSDGQNSLREMVIAAKNLGYEYIGISDHSQSAAYANGLKPEQVKLQHQEIDSLNKELHPFRIFKGIESDILSDGSLDYAEEVLKSFDFIIASVHSGFKMSSEKMTSRVVRAIENPFTTIVGHLTGRKLLKRESYSLEMDQIFKSAAKYNVAIEFNANPQRLDLDWRYIKEATDLGISIPICSDAHSIEDLSNIRFALEVARKGWLTADKILNQFDVNEISNFFSSRSKNYLHTS